jgi:hypothetical protein
MLGPAYAGRGSSTETCSKSTPRAPGLVTDVAEQTSIRRIAAEPAGAW